MTPVIAMEMADRLRPNDLGQDLKMQWLTDIENECVEHLNRHDGYSMEPWVCTEDEAMTELILSEPYEMAYVYKLMAEIDRAVGEYDRYNNDAQICNGYMDEWKAWFRRGHTPRKSGRQGWKLI